MLNKMEQFTTTATPAPAQATTITEFTFFGVGYVNDLFLRKLNRLKTSKSC